MKIYLATKYYSDWDGSSTHMIRAYKSRSEGLKYVKKGNRVFKDCERFYRLKNKQFERDLNLDEKLVSGKPYYIKHRKFEGWSFELVEIDLV